MPYPPVCHHSHYWYRIVVVVEAVELWETSFQAGLLISGWAGCWQLCCQRAVHVLINGPAPVIHKSTAWPVSCFGQYPHGSAAWSNLALIVASKATGLCLDLYGHSASLKILRCFPCHIWPEPWSGSLMLSRNYTCDVPSWMWCTQR